MITYGTLHTVIQLGNGTCHFCLKATLYPNLHQSEASTRALGDPENKE